MAFTRKFLIDNGVPEDKVDAIMAERNRTLTDYIPKADMQAQIDAALEAAKQTPPDVTASAEYKAVVAERDMLRAIGGSDFENVKPKFREQVFGMLDRSEKAPAVSDQLTKIKESYEEYFTVKQETPPPESKPAFGAPTQGSAPTGKTGDSFSDYWGFNKKT